VSIALWIRDRPQLVVYIVRRTRIYLYDLQIARLDERAASEGVARSAVICHAVDDYLARGQQNADEWRLRWREAVMRTAGIASHLPDGATYVEQLRAVDLKLLRESDR
jgi:hypothetical protein